MKIYLAGNFDQRFVAMLAKSLQARGHRLTSGLDTPNLSSLATDAVMIDSRHPRATTLIGVFRQAGFPIIIVHDVGPTLGVEDAAARKWHQLGATFCLRRLYDVEGLDELVDILLEHLRVEAPVLDGMVV